MFFYHESTKVRKHEKERNYKLRVFVVIIHNAINLGLSIHMLYAVKELKLRIQAFRFAYV